MPLFLQSQNQYYSWNYGNIHFISVNYMFYQDLLINTSTSSAAKAMLAWIENDIQMANNSRAQGTGPEWIIVYSHYPIYCSLVHVNESNCTQYYPQFKMWDQLWYNYSVDLVLSAHSHYWER
jgi:hypothetical protein